MLHYRHTNQSNFDLISLLFSTGAKSMCSTARIPDSMANTELHTSHKFSRSFNRRFQIDRRANTYRFIGSPHTLQSNRKLHLLLIGFLHRLPMTDRRTRKHTETHSTYANNNNNSANKNKMLEQERINKTPENCY